MAQYEAESRDLSRQARWTRQLQTLFAGRSAALAGLPVIGVGPLAEAIGPVTRLRHAPAPFRAHDPVTGAARSFFASCQRIWSDDAPNRWGKPVAEVLFVRVGVL